MQGNASDLMHGLPIQSTHRADHLAYHEPIRLMTIVYAPREAVLKVISENSLLTNLTKNAWVKFCCIDPRDKKVYLLTTSLTWINHEPL